jgi:phosphoglycerate dehydrogenase-like enzyme
VQGPTAGVDHPRWQQLLDRGVRLTNASGVWAEPIAQYVITWTLAWAQGMEGQLLRSEHHEWTRVAADDLTARTMGIVGYGGTGSSCARIARAIGMRVIGVRRSGHTDRHVDEMVRTDELHRVLADSDYVVLCAPYTDETRDMIGAAEFAAMGPDTAFINVARGELVDEAARWPMRSAPERSAARRSTSPAPNRSPSSRRCGTSRTSS